MLSPSSIGEHGSDCWEHTIGAFLLDMNATEPGLDVLELKKHARPTSPISEGRISKSKTQKPGTLETRGTVSGSCDKSETVTLGLRKQKGSFECLKRDFFCFIIKYQKGSIG